MIKIEKHTIVPLVFLTVLMASLAGNVYLGQIVRSGRVNAQTLPSVAREAKTGQKLDAINAMQPEGASLQISLQGDRPTVLYIFSPSCGWCARNLQNIETLSIQAKDRYRFIGLSTGASHSLSAYLKQHPFPFPAYEHVSDADLKTLDFGGTPQTVLVSAGGIVQHNWTGAYTGLAEDAIQKYFSVRLPGLVSATTSHPMTSTPAKSEP